jgi:hypothetical protein
MSGNAAVHLVDLRQQIIGIVGNSSEGAISLIARLDNACLLYRNVPLNNFRILTSEIEDHGGIHYHAYLTNIDLAAENHRQLNGVLLSTDDVKLDEPAKAIAALLLKTAALINQWFTQNRAAME